MHCGGGEGEKRIGKEMYIVINLSDNRVVYLNTCLLFLS